MKLQRKLKKRIIKFFGRGTYMGIIDGAVFLEKFCKGRGVIVRHTGKDTKEFYHDGQCHPYQTFPKIKTK